MQYYELNREERHYGFLFMTAMITNPLFRNRVFDLLNEKTGTCLDPNDFDVYAEVALFRDYWYSFGDPKKYSKDIENRRLEMLSNLFNAMKLNREVINNDGMFWTGKIGASKLWFPGRWAMNEIRKIEAEQTIGDDRLKRCRWLCNAKPDIMIQSRDRYLFIEVKVESGMGKMKSGYSQEKTLADIIEVAGKVIDSMQSASIKKICLTKKAESDNLSWEQVRKLHSESQAGDDIGYKMIERHFKKMNRNEVLG